MPDLGAMLGGGGGGGLGGMLGGGALAQAAPAAEAAPEAAPQALPQENILSTATSASLVTSGGIGSSDPSVGEAREKFANL